MKRITDIILSTLVIVTLLWWMIPLLGLIIWMDSGRPVFFLQRRTGLKGKPFTCIKLRTMIINPESETRQSSRNDSRITRVGLFLRETNLDELPQFFNVLLGQMSIVGPRPHMLAHTDSFGKQVVGYEKRLQVRPGITGLAQIKGYRGATPDYRSIYKRVQWDNYYVENQSVWLDLVIIAKTGAHLINRLFAWNG